MNGDDSMAFGAAYMCANSSKNFLGSRKTFMQNGANEIFKFYLKNLENTSKPYNYCEENDNEKTNCDIKIEKDKEIFPLRHKYNSKRSIEIELNTNIEVKITEEFPGKFGERDLKRYELTGVPEAIEQMKKDNVTSLPKIKIQFIYNKAGLIELDSYIKYKYPRYFCKDFYYTKNYTEPLPKEEIEKIDSILNKSIVLSENEMKKLIKNTTNDTESEDDDDLDDSDDLENEEDDVLNNTNTKIENNETKDNNDTKKNTIKKKKKKIKKIKPTPSNYTFNDTLYITTDEKKRLKNLKKIGQKKDEEEKIYLKIKEFHLLTPKPMNDSQISKARKKLSRFIEIDTNRTKLIEKKNKLEILIFQRKEWLESEHSKPYLKPGELENSTIFINNKSFWFEEESYSASYETLEKVIKNITNYFKPFERRQKRHYDRVQAINKFFNDLNSTQKRVVKILTDKPWTEEYFNTTFMKEYNETLEWFNKTYSEQESIPHWEPEVLTPYMLNKKMDDIRKFLKKKTKMKN